MKLDYRFLPRNPQKWLSGRRVGLFTHAAAVAPDFTQTLDALLAQHVRVTALFGPEHGFDGVARTPPPLPTQPTLGTAIPLYSLYGTFKQPTSEMLAEVDILVFDMQDVGARFYTFISISPTCSAPPPTLAKK